MSDLENYVRSYFGIEQIDISGILSLFKEQTVKKNEFFTQTDKQCTKLAFVQSGAFRISALTKEKDITQWISTKGEFICDLSSLLFNTPSRWNIQALTDSKIFLINSEDYLNLSKYEPNWPELEKLFLAKCFITLENRVFSLLSMSAEERYTYFLESKKELFNLIPHHYIASMLGMSPETLSRVRKSTSK